MTKAWLRTHYKEKRLALSGYDKHQLDDQLLIQFQQLQLLPEQVLLSFFPIDKMNEPNTLLLTSYVRHFCYDVTIAYPKINKHDNTMQAIAIDEDTVYKANSLGIFEPKQNDIVNPLDVSMVFVPLLAFDKLGNRVGYGKGYYDRYLQQTHASTIKIGLSYFEPVDKITDTNPWDIALDYCITPQQVYGF